MTYRNPVALLLIIPVLLAVFWNFKRMLAGTYSENLMIPWRRAFQSSVSRFPFPPRLPPLVLAGIGTILIIVALARPQTSYSKIRHNIEGIDIMLVLDLSQSMNIEDFRNQSRIDVAKPIMKSFIDGRPNDRVGFLVFSGEAVTLVPPTLDHAVLGQTIGRVDAGDLKDGTAIGDALATAVGRLKESVARSRVIVLLTDGDNNIGRVDPLTAGELAKGYGIRVYSIAIGTEGRVSLPFKQKDIFGRTFKQYVPYENTINPELLKKISSMTNGKFYRVQGDEQMLREVFSDIDQLEKTKIERNEQVRYDEHFMPFAVWGLVFLTLSFLVQNVLRRVYP